MHFDIRAILRLIITFLAAATASLAAAQTVITGGVEIVPAQPSSADTVFLKIPRDCASSNYIGSTYRTTAFNGKIRVEIQLAAPPLCPAVGGPGGPPAPALLVEIGRLPSGSYVLDVVQGRPVSFEVAFTNIASSVPLTVSDHRATKTAPAVLLNYSDHWWDPNNAGTGLFIWQDARDQLLAAWFTYGADGKPAWYTIQAGTWVTATQYEGKLVQTNRPPGPIDASGPTSLQFVGNATLDFSGNDGAIAGKFTTKFDNTDVVQTRNIRRFGK